jgi:hypothetical protein
LPHLRPFIFGIAALLIVPTGALAQDGAVGTPVAAPVASAFEIAPEADDDPAVTALGYFVYELAAGDKASGAVRLWNPSIEPVTVELAAVDAETAQTGGSAFADAEATPIAAGSWVRLVESRVTLDPGEQTSVEFTVQSPSETAPGQYLAGIVAYVPAAAQGTPTAAGSNEAGASVTMQTRYVIGVQVDVPGEWTPALTITGASALEQPSGTKLGIAILNDGDEFLKPEGSVTLLNAAATPILTQPIALGTFLTGTDITYPVAWPGVPAGGDYGVEVELNYATDKVARYSGMLTVGDNAPVAAPLPGDEPRPVVAPVPVPAQSLIQPWMILLFAGFLGLIVILLIVVIVRTTRPRW